MHVVQLFDIFLFVLCVRRNTRVLLKTTSLLELSLFVAIIQLFFVGVRELSQDVNATACEWNLKLLEKEFSFEYQFF